MRTACDTIRYIHTDNRNVHTVIYTYERKIRQADLISQAVIIIKIYNWTVYLYLWEI